MKIRDAGFECMNGILLTSDIHIAICEVHDSLKNATYLITALIDIPLSRKSIFIAFTKDGFHLLRRSAHSC
jgi:hypothetical protein